MQPRGTRGKHFRHSGRSHATNGEDPESSAPIRTHSWIPDKCFAFSGMTSKGQICFTAKAAKLREEETAGFYFAVLCVLCGRKLFSFPVRPVFPVVKNVFTL